MDRDEIRRIAKAQIDSEKRAKNPQASLLYRIIARFTHMQLGYLSRDNRHSRTAVRVFVFLEALTSLAIIATIAYLVQLPLHDIPTHPIQHPFSNGYDLTSFFRHMYYSF